MRERLGETLEYVFQEVGLHLKITPPAARAVVEQILSMPQSPHTFGAYYDLVFALERNDVELARTLAKELSLQVPSDSLAIQDQ